MSVSESYNSWADQYDAVINRTRDLDREATIEILRQYDFKSVLELGCGTGKNTEWIMTKAESIIGLDFSAEMLAIAKKKIDSRKVEFKSADLTQNWAIENESVDLVISNLVLEHIEDLNHIFAQANQKLADNGIFFISELHPFKQYAGSKARFDTANGIKEITAFVHHTTDYTNSAKSHGFVMESIKEWFDNDEEKELPRLISFVFRKAKIS
ncbi:MAG: class I SAM-dependent methyltransferase [Saprospiraceae bacterium]